MCHSCIFLNYSTPWKVEAYGFYYFNLTIANMPGLKQALASFEKQTLPCGCRESKSSVKQLSFCGGWYITFDDGSW